MPDGDGSSLNLIGIVLIFVLVAANGFFVAAEFSLVAVRPSRVAELVAGGSRRALVLQRAIQHLDVNLAATQLGITISSLALGWIGEPALAGLIQPLWKAFPDSLATAGAHAVAVVVSFSIITTLHIVLGELAPKSLALQRSESTALVIVRPLGLFLLILRPAIVILNGLGNLILRLCGLRPGTGESSLHSPEELKLLVQASQDAGILQDAQEEVVLRVLNIGERQVGDIMTARPEIDWVNADSDRADMLDTIRNCPHEQLLVGRGSIDEPLGMLLKKDLLNRVLGGEGLDPLEVIREPLLVLESMSVFRMLDMFKQAPVRLAIVVDEYGILQGIVTQTDLLEAIAGDLPNSEDGSADIIEREDGSLLLDGMTPAHDVFDRLAFRKRPENGDYHTVAGFALSQLGHLPGIGESFVYEDWCFEIVDLDGRRIGKILATRMTLVP
ncbi:protein of unknown function DUF21 (plasmid) [Nitrobacter hamburgensis X14]|uniref:Hemolysin n=1 Tax=Nitrobacter hamburgensis (strain DSM 10229 / NCIMB 13809 / X14) TaxID=323097 RepID=Q1QF33_NITHX|nr:hemolysin family protein [Nitrobacter hamburgensis]ABE65164.1 protein of unknown function DUF21 [Nitrobacter hamburgensis X14]